MNGNVVIDFIYDDVSSFSEWLAKVRKGWKSMEKRKFWIDKINHFN